MSENTNNKPDSDLNIQALGCENPNKRGGIYAYPPGIAPCDCHDDIILPIGTIASLISKKLAKKWLKSNTQKGLNIWKGLLTKTRAAADNVYTNLFNRLDYNTVIKSKPIKVKIYTGDFFGEDTAVKTFEFPVLFREHTSKVSKFKNDILAKCYDLKSWYDSGTRSLRDLIKQKLSENLIPTWKKHGIDRLTNDSLFIYTWVRDNGRPDPKDLAALLNKSKDALDYMLQNGIKNTKVIETLQNEIIMFDRMNKSWLTYSKSEVSSVYRQVMEKLEGKLKKDTVRITYRDIPDDLSIPPDQWNKRTFVGSSIEAIEHMESQRAKTRALKNKLTHSLDEIAQSMNQSSSLQQRVLDGLSNRFATLGAIVLGTVVDILNLFSLVELHKCDHGPLLDDETCECSICPHDKRLCTHPGGGRNGAWGLPTLPGGRTGDELWICVDGFTQNEHRFLPSEEEFEYFSDGRNNLNQAGTDINGRGHCMPWCVQPDTNYKDEPKFRINMECNDPKAPGHYVINSGNLPKGHGGRNFKANQGYVCATQLPPDGKSPDAWFESYRSKYHWDKTKCKWVCANGNAPEDCAVDSQSFHDEDYFGDLWDEDKCECYGASQLENLIP